MGVMPCLGKLNPIQFMQSYLLNEYTKPGDIQFMLMKLHFIQFDIVCHCNFQSLQIHIWCLVEIISMQNCSNIMHVKIGGKKDYNQRTVRLMGLSKKVRWSFEIFIWLLERASSSSPWLVSRSSPCTWGKHHLRGSVCNEDILERLPWSGLDFSVTQTIHHTHCGRLLFWSDQAPMLHHYREGICRKLFPTWYSISTLLIVSLWQWWITVFFDLCFLGVLYHKWSIFVSGAQKNSAPRSGNLCPN